MKVHGIGYTLGICIDIGSASSHFEGSSTSVGRPGYCHSPVIPVKNVDVHQPILLDISPVMVSMYLSFGIPLGLTPSTSMSSTILVI